MRFAGTVAKEPYIYMVALWGLMSLNFKLLCVGRQGIIELRNRRGVYDGEASRVIEQ